MTAAIRTARPMERGGRDYRSTGYYGAVTSGYLPKFPGGVLVVSVLLTSPTLPRVLVSVLSGLLEFGFDFDLGFPGRRCVLRWRCDLRFVLSDDELLSLSDRGFARRRCATL